MALWVSIADVETWLGPGIDDISAGVIANAASDAVRDHIERDLALQTYTGELYNSNGTDYILLNNWPVQSVSSVTISDWPFGSNLVPAGPNKPGYRIAPENPRKLVFAGYGRLPRGILNISVSYTAGYDMSLAPGGVPPAMPANIYLALKLTANAIYNAQAADTNLRSESTAGVFSGTYDDQGAGGVPRGAQSLLRNYKRTAP
jgi:hypothetical protein